jgi:hypothetical protein
MCVEDTHTINYISCKPELGQVLPSEQIMGYGLRGRDKYSGMLRGGKEVSRRRALRNG